MNETQAAGNARDARARGQQATRGLSIGILLFAGIEFVVGTTAVQMRTLPSSTDFATYYLAAQLARDHISPYDSEALSARGTAIDLAYEPFPYLYPPAFAWALQPLAQLTYARARQVWMMFATLALLAALGVTALAMRQQAALLRLGDSNFYWVLLAAFVAAALNSAGVHSDIRAGSVGILLFLAFAVLAWALVTNRPGWAGIAIAVATLVKLTPIVLVPYVIWRGGKKTALFASASLVALNAPAVLHWGWSIASDYVETLARISTLDFERPMNQSLDAMLSRLLVPTDLVRAPLDAPRLKDFLSLFLNVVLGLATIRALMRRQRAAALLPVELGLVVLALLMLMKVTWLQTLAAMLFAWPLAMLPLQAAAASGAPGARRWSLMACVGFFLAAAHLPVMWLALRHGPQVVCISAHLFGLFCLWLVCHKLLRSAWLR